MNNRKRGVALLLTLLVIVAIISIIAITFEHLETISKTKKSISALIQANLFYENIASLLKEYLPKNKNNDKILNTLYATPILLSRKSNSFNLKIECKPLYTGIPIQWFDKSNKKSNLNKYKLTQIVTNYLFDKYEIENPSMLEIMIIDSIKGKVNSNFSFQKNLNLKKNLISKMKLDLIISNYMFQTGDLNVFNIPWEKYFIFEDINKNYKIDGKHISKDLISILFDISVDTINEEWQEDTNIHKFIKNNYLSNNQITMKLFSEKGINAMNCQQNFIFQKENYAFAFNYINERINNFVFHTTE